MKVLGVFESGTVAKAAQSPETLTAEEKAAIAPLDPRRMGAPSMDQEMQSILTEDQYEVHTAKKEQKRIGDAEDRTTDQLKSLGRKFDLSQDQKDSIFQQLATLELQPNASATRANGEPFPQIGSRVEARDDIIRCHLTPQQTEIFDQDRALEKAALQSQMREFHRERAAIQGHNINP